MIGKAVLLTGLRIKSILYEILFYYILLKLNFSLYSTRRTPHCSLYITSSLFH